MKNNSKQQITRRKNRVKSKIEGSDRARLVVFKSLTNNYAQLIDNKSKKTIIGVSDLKLKKGTKTEKAKQVGIEMAKKALEKNITTCVFDRHGYRYHGRIKAIAEGAREGGLKF
jgi:large subunit ribosomal protein L18